jgi:hypothetical protein
VWSRGENLTHVLYECEALVTLRYIYFGSFFLDPGDVRILSLGTIWDFIKGTGAHDFDNSLRATKDLSKKGLHALGLRGLEPTYFSILFYFLLFYSCVELYCMFWS